MPNFPGILVVDDEQDMRALLKDILEEQGYTVTVAQSGREALKALGERDYGVVLTDLRMKEMQGIELLTEVRRTYPDINVILMTAFGSVETAIEAMAARWAGCSIRARWTSRRIR
ncbi:MAG: response regulator [Nitrospiraceae bacterium]